MSEVAIQASVPGCSDTYTLSIDVTDWSVDETDSLHQWIGRLAGVDVAYMDVDGREVIALTHANGRD